MNALVRAWSLRGVVGQSLWVAPIVLLLVSQALAGHGLDSPPSRPILFVHGYCDDTDSWAALRGNLASRLNKAFPFLYPLADSADNQDPANYYEVYYDGTAVHFVQNGVAIYDESEIPSTARFFSMHFFDPQSGSWRPLPVAQVSILNKAEELAQVLREINRVTQISDVIVIAHSEGGLVSRAYLENMASILSCYDYNGGTNGSPDYSKGFCLPGGDEYHGEIAQLITLDTPHGGADLAGGNTGWFNYLFPSCQFGPSTTHTEMIPGSALLQNLNYLSNSIASASRVPSRVEIQAIESSFSVGNPPWESFDPTDPLFSLTTNDGLISIENQSMEMSLATGFKNGAQFGDWGNPYTTESLQAQTACQLDFPLTTIPAGPLLHFLRCVGGQLNTQALVYSIVKPIVAGTLDSITVKATFDSGNGKGPQPWTGSLQYHLEPSNTIGGNNSPVYGNSVPNTFPASTILIGSYSVVYDSGGPQGTNGYVSVGPVISILDSQDWNPTFTIGFTKKALSPTITNISASATQVAQGVAVTFTANVQATGPTPTGTMTFLDGSYTIASAPVASTGLATYTTAGLTPGSHSITARYGGNSNFMGSDSIAPIEITVTGTPPVINDFSLQVSPASQSVIVSGTAGYTLSTTTTSGSPQAITLSASSLPTGVSPIFTPNSLTTGSSAILGFATTSSTSPGTYQITVTANSSSTAHSRVITLIVSTSSGTPVASFSPSSLRFPNQAVGTVSQTQGVEVRNTGSTVLIISSMPSAQGNFQVSGGYSTYVYPNTQFQFEVAFAPTSSGLQAGQILIYDNAPNSPQVIPVIGNGVSIQQASSITLSSSANPSTYGGQITLTATLTPSSGSGHSTDGEVITFYSGNVVLGTGTLSAGVANLIVNLLPEGINSITAVFGGDANLAPATSLPVLESVFGTSASSALSLTPGIITTSAGDGVQGYSGDGKSATSAEFNGASGVAVDVFGNVYVADTWNNVVRRIDALSGEIATVAGDGYGAGLGYGGYSGDGGSAINADLYFPSGVAVDPMGNLYIADSQNSRIRVVNTQSAAITLAGVTIQPGAIATIAGDGNQSYAGDDGAATGAQLNEPSGITVDAAGNIYVADKENHVVRMVSTGAASPFISGTAITGYIYTVAGNNTPGFSGDAGLATTAQLLGPQGVSVDGQGNLYIADTGNNRVRMVSAITNANRTSSHIYTITGSSAAGYSGDGGPSTSAQLQSPGGIAVDAANNLYVADTGNDRIREVSAATGIISTIAGNGGADYAGDNGPATSAKLDQPQALGVNLSNGDVLIADAGNSRIREIQVQQASIGFGPVVLGSRSQAQDVIVSNVGNQMLTINVPYGDLAFTLLEPDTDCGPGTSLGSGESCVVGIGFIPQVPGPDSETVTISGNATNSPQTISLSGTGLIVPSTPSLALYPTNDPSTYGGQTVLTAILSSNSGTLQPTSGENINFLNGSTNIGTGTLGFTGQIAAATLILSSLPTGRDTLTAYYGGDAYFNPAASNSLVQVVHKAAPTIAWTKPGSILYGTRLDAAELNATATGVDGKSLPGNFAYTPVAGTTLASGNHTLSLTFTPADTTDYSSVTKTVSLTVTRPILTVTAASSAVVYNQLPPTPSYSVAGFVNGETSSVLSGSPNETTNATQGSPVGRYPIAIAKGTLTAANYGFLFKDGVLTISPIGAAAIPVFKLPAGTYTSVQLIAITETTPGATIFYTTDRTRPTTSSTKYTGPITVSKSETIQAIAVATGYTQSAIASATYAIHLSAAAPILSPAKGAYPSIQAVQIADATRRMEPNRRLRPRSMQER